MICPSCGNENRPGARFCARCGAPLEEAPYTQPPELQTTAESARPAGSGIGGDLSDTTQVAGKVGLFGGHGLITVGALIALFAFILPWASCGNLQLSGLDIVTQSSQYGGDASSTFLILVPLGALALLVLGIAGLAANLLGKSLPTNLARLMPFLPLLAVLPGLCGCCPSLAFLLEIQNARSDPENLGLGMLVRVEYGFWLTLFGLGLSFIGIVIALAGGLAARRRVASGGSGSATHS